MRKLVLSVVLFVPAFCVAQKLDQKVERITAQALAQSVVQVQVQLAKPVYMSDVMVRPVRGRDMVICVDRKQVQCTGRLSAQKTHVIVPLSCVVQDKYHASKIHLTFANGHRIQRSGKSVQTQKKGALIRI